MAEDRIEVGIVVARRRLSGPWASHAWLPVAALSAAPDTAPWTLLSASESEDLFYAGATDLLLHPSATSHYRDNLAAAQPSIWVALRVAAGEEQEIASVTVDPYEGEALAEGIGEIIEAVPMPAEVQAHLARYVETFHVERVFHKRQRDRADPEALARDEHGRDGRRKEPT